MFCASSAGGTLQLWDNATVGSGSLLVNTFSLIASAWFPIPIHFINGCYATIAGTADVTFIYQ